MLWHFKNPFRTVSEFFFDLNDSWDDFAGLFNENGVADADGGSAISSSRAIIRSSVDVPQPDGPSSTQNSPSSMPTSTPRMTWVWPNAFATRSIATDATVSLLDGRRL